MDTIVQEIKSMLFLQEPKKARYTCGQEVTRQYNLMGALNLLFIPIQAYICGRPYNFHLIINNYKNIKTGGHIKPGANLTTSKGGFAN